MTTNAVLAGAPFPEDQLAQLKRLLAGATREQRIWLSGYIAGLDDFATPQAAVPAAPPATKAKLTILYATESGNAEALAGAARKTAARLGFNAKTLDMADTTPAQLAKLGNVLVIASTWGEGDPPQRAEAFHAALMAADAPRLEGVKYAVLALGDRAYAQFCQVGRQFDARFAELGATRLAPVVECDLDYKKPAAAWIDASLRLLDDKQADSTAAVIAFPRPAAAEDEDAEPVPFAAEIGELVNLNSSRSDIETYHVALSLEGSGIAYEPGDSLGFLPTNDPALVEDVLRTAALPGDAALATALTRQYDITLLTRGQVAAYAALTGDAKLTALAADEPALAQFLADRQFIDLLEAAPHALTAEQLTGLLRPLPPRLYSVASSRKSVDEEAHLLIAKVQWESHGRTRKGVASGQVAERLQVGDTLPVYLKANPHFRPPEDTDRPVVMIGPGTGVAPFRAFLQEREALGAKGRNWLFFGARRFMHDFLYQLDWQDWAKSGLLSRIDLAFSRDQREKIYVQHRMWEARRDLYAWIKDGAAIYVCGDAKAMAKDVHAALLAVIADQSGAGPEAAANELRTLQRDGRYKRDVY
ncbi:MAG: flavodoxin domain-containing protein [Acetobacteraceae bacterium]|nr:flavodoxin domain-containing protein [Acetobacteraceae bacterium]